MFRETIKVSILALVFVLFSCATSGTSSTSGNSENPPQQRPPQKTKDNSFKVSIEQNGKNVNASNDIYTLEDQKFNILINNVNDKTIHIFAYHNEEMFSKYSYPVECENTVIFNPATALIDNANENKEITLTINIEMQYNVITPEKRATHNNTAVIKIKDIADYDGKYDGTLYLTIFVDLNDNDIIEANEVKNISLSIDRTAKSILFGDKIYISTIGSRIKDIKNYEYSNEYLYAKITSDPERQLFLLLFGKNNFVNPNSTVNRIIATDYSKYNLYVVFSPITTQVELDNNPYHYSGENKLIFDTITNKEANNGTYVFCREYRVEKNKDIYEMWINDNGKLKKIKKYDL
ncbi:hypothetical protein [Treponema sp. R6D11]